MLSVERGSEFDLVNLPGNQIALLVEILQGLRVILLLGKLGKLEEIVRGLGKVIERHDETAKRLQLLDNPCAFSLLSQKPGVAMRPSSSSICSRPLSTSTAPQSAWSRSRKSSMLAISSLYS